MSCLQCQKYKNVFELRDFSFEFKTYYTNILDLKAIFMHLKHYSQLYLDKQQQRKSALLRY